MLFYEFLRAFGNVIHLKGNGTIVIIITLNVNCCYHFFEACQHLLSTVNA